jgi:hypothetical protein
MQSRPFSFFRGSKKAVSQHSKTLLVGSLIPLLLANTLSAGQSADPCGQAEADLKAKVAAIETRYEAKLNAKKADYQKQADQIRHDADENQPTGFGGVTGFDVNVDWKDTSIMFDLPVVTLNQTTMVMGMPEVTLSQQKWIYDLPATRMRDMKVGQHPEITCRSIFDCTVEFKDNIVGVPEFYMEPHETVIGIPEFAVRDQKLIFGLPAIAMERQEIVMGLPWITVKSVDAEVGVAQSEASDFQQKAKSDTSELTTAMKSEIGQAASKELHAVFQCQKSRLEANRTKALASIDAQLSKAKSAAEDARAKHAAAAANTADAVVKQILVTRTAVNAQFDEALKQLTESEQKALASF